LFGGVPAKELHALVPLVHVVWVLPQHHTAQQLGPPLGQPLKPSQPAEGSRVEEEAATVASAHATRIYL
jgi:hypothetical protein